MRKFSFFLVSLLCLCGNVWAGRYGQLNVHVVLDNNGSYIVDKSSIAEVDATDGEKANNPTGFVSTGIKSLSFSSGAIWDIDCQYVAYAYPMDGYKVVGWSIDSENNTIASSHQFYQSFFTATSSKSGSPTIKNIYVHIAVDDNPVSYNFTSSYTPQAGNFILLNYGTNQFLTATGSGLGVTNNENSATIFHLNNGNSTSLEYKDNSNNYYLIHQNGTFQTNNTTSKNWTIEASNITNFYRFKLKNTDNDRFIYIDGLTVNPSMPRSNEWTEYNRSWALVPVFLFHTTAPTGLVGGTQTWSVANATKIPLSSNGFSGQSTTATFAASPSTNYHFAGWWDNSSYDGDAVLSDASYTNKTITNSNCAETLRYYAKFVPYFNFSGVAPHNVEGCSVEISYSPSGTPIEGGVYIDGTTSDQESQDCTITFTAITDEYHNFAGWYDNADFDGDYISMSASIDVPVTNETPGSKSTVTYYPKFVTEKVPVFTWNNSSVIVGRNYPSVFSSTNNDNAYSIESDDETVAKVIDGTLYAYKEGTATFTVNQVSGNDWIEHTETFVVLVNPVPEWGWISEEPANGDFYIRVKGSSKYLNNNNKVGDINTIWTLTASDGTWSIVEKSDNTNFVEILCKTTRSSTLTLQASDMAVYSDGTTNTWNTDDIYTRTALRTKGSTEKGYAIYASNMRFGGLSSQNTDVYSSFSGTDLVASLNEVYPWEFISKAQYDARVAYQNAVTFAAIADNHLSASLRTELNEVMDANDDASDNYTDKAFTTCKTNLDNIVAKCSTYIAHLEDAISLRRDVSNNGYYMFYNASEDARLGDDVQAYTASWSGDNLVLTAVPNQVIPAATVALVYSNSKSEFYYALEDQEAESIGVNAFVHHTNSYETDGHTDYILTAQRDGENNITSYAFAKFTGSDHSLLRDKNVLVWSAPTPAPSLIRIFEEENTPTALIPVYEDESTEYKPQENSQIYTILGIPVSDMSRPGIYIQNGKKYIVH